MDANNTMELCGYYYSVLKSASNADGIDFPYDYMQFVDMLTAEQMVEIGKILLGDNKEEKEKKTKK